MFYVLKSGTLSALQEFIVLEKNFFHKTCKPLRILIFFYSLFSKNLSPNALYLTGRTRCIISVCNVCYVHVFEHKYVHVCVYMYMRTCIYPSTEYTYIK